MNVRSITCFVNAGPAGDGPQNALQAAGRLARQVHAALEAAGLPVQSRRLATQPLSSLPGDLLALARDLAGQAAAAGFDYLSLGPVLAAGPGAGPAVFLAGGLENSAIDRDSLPGPQRNVRL